VRVEALGCCIGAEAFWIPLVVLLVLVAGVAHDEDHLLARVQGFESWNKAVFKPPLESVTIHVLVIVDDLAVGLPDPFGSGDRFHPFGFLSKRLLPDGIASLITGDQKVIHGRGVENNEAFAFRARLASERICLRNPGRRRGVDMVKYVSSLKTTTYSPRG